MKTLLKKLQNLKAEIGKISKESTNPFFKSKYFDINKLLEHAEPMLHHNGLLLLQPIKDNKVYSEIYCTETGEWIHSAIELPQINDPQKLGSAITYYRRYTLQSLLALQAEDDDANTASKVSKDLPWLSVNSKEWIGALNKETNLETLRKYFRISKANAEQYTLELNKK